MKETDHTLNQLVDDALREMPLLSTPRGIYPEIMKRITSSTETPAWRFSWIDFSLSAVLALITGFFLDLIQGITRSPYWYAKARVELLLLWQDLKLFFLQNYTGVLAGALSLLTVLSLLVILGEVYRRQVASTRRIPV
jgi:hypothetical protein